MRQGRLMHTLRSRAAVLGAWVLAGAMLATPPRAEAHEKGVLRLVTREFPVGGSFRLAGEKFARGATLRLLLVGTQGRVELGRVRADSAGRFAGDLEVAAGLAAGAYRLVAIATDGDEVASTDVSVVPPAAAPSCPLCRAPGSNLAGHLAPPSGEPLALLRARSGAVTGGAAATIVVALLAAAVLLRFRPGAA